MVIPISCVVPAESIHPFSSVTPLLEANQSELASLYLFIQ